MKKVFEKPEDLSEYLFRIVDNGAATADRYTVVFSDGSYLGMSGSPTHPQGVSMCGEDIDPQVVEDWVEEGTAVDLALGDLPSHLVEHIMFRNNEGLEDFLEAVERRDPKAVAASREAADPCEGLSTDLGKGIYMAGEDYMVRIDGDETGDRGPFKTAREAVLATVPDQYALSGPEYHSSEDVTRMEPSETVRKAVEALEAKVTAEWEANLQSRM